MRRNNLDNPLFIFFIFILTIIVNTISSIYFLSITLAGLVFTAFFVCLKKKYYYSLFLTILAFLFIEVNSGLRPLSLTLLSLFIHVYVLPYINRIMSFSKLNTYLYITIFYIGILILWSFQTEITSTIFFSIILNIFIDFILFGVMI